MGLEKFLPRIIVNVIQFENECDKGFNVSDGLMAQGFKLVATLGLSSAMAEKGEEVHSE